MSCIPKSYLPKRHNLPWLTKFLIQLIKKKNHLFRKARSTKDPSVEKQYSSTRNKVVAKLRKAKQDYFQHLNPANCKEFWKTVKYINKGQNSIPVLTDIGSDDQEVANTNADKANALNKFFSRCFNYAFPPLSTGECEELATENVCPDDLLCTEEEIFDYLSSLDTTKANGPDGISAKMLKESSPAITSSLTKLFNTSIKLGEVPSEWKHALVTPIPKSSDLSSVSNYHPISLLSIISKILERHIHSLVLKHLNENYPISAAQYGFLKGRSTTGALVTAIDEWHNYLENGYDVCTVFFDLKKAFDSVPHHALLEKLIHLNLNQHLQK